ncbi:hypothetical protein [Pararhizobium sp. IMCC21322]|uniref:hypothetical protein n=1 Tax=Pararhizobium sp. IMCC21322 TaxID=3067903 RepID=UPI0027428C1F|nr:hypothetical protein [Pararhizobium sp. IMCC21322]
MNDVKKFLATKFADNDYVRELLTALYEEFTSWGIKDNIFDQDFTDGEPHHFFPRVWEMVLARHLVQLGYDVSSKDAGPDFLIEHNGQRIWIEAVCPSPVGLPDEWINPMRPDEGSRLFSVPHEAMLLRWTSALKEKNDKLVGAKNKEGYLEKGIVDEDDAYIIAISACQLGMGLLTYRGISQYPFAVEAVFPIGPYEIVLDRETFSTTEVRHQYRPAIAKPKTGAEVSTDNFLDSDYKGVSTVIGTNAGINAACGAAWPLAHVHNPNARNPIPKGILEGAEEFFATDMGDFLQLEKLS